MTFSVSKFVLCVILCLAPLVQISSAAAGVVYTTAEPTSNPCVVCVRGGKAQPEGFKVAAELDHPCHSPATTTTDYLILNLYAHPNRALSLVQVRRACEALVGPPSRRLQDRQFADDIRADQVGIEPVSSPFQENGIGSNQTLLISGAAGGLSALAAGITGVVVSNKRKNKANRTPNSSNDSTHNKDAWGASVVMSFASDSPNADSPEIVDAPSPIENESADMTSVTLTMF